MADNNAPEPLDPQPALEHTRDRAWFAFTSEQSRRKFLRDALIGSAVVTAGVGAAATVIVTGAGAAPAGVRPQITRRLNAARSQLSPLDPSSLCIEDTSLPGSAAGCFGNGTNTNGEFWIFFTIRSVAAGDYTAEITQSTDGGLTQQDFTTTSTPFKLQDPKKSVHIILGGTPDNCPKSIPDNTAVSNDDPIAVHVGSAEDVQIAIHIAYNSTATSGTFTFNATLKTSPGGVLVAAPAAVAVVTPCP